MHYRLLNEEFNEKLNSLMTVNIKNHNKERKVDCQMATLTKEQLLYKCHNKLQTTVLLPKESQLMLFTCSLP